MSLKTPHQQRIEAFMRLAKQDVPEAPVIPNDKILRLRAALILEEALETIDALGCDVLVDRTIFATKANTSVVSSHPASLEDVADGCADISVVTIGTLSACGIPDEPLLEMVDQNNLDKFGEGHSIRADGKLIKPPSHQPPKIKEYIQSLK
jgi:predicted HAD superfamily Cof-like phosphohydrolase